MNRSGSKGSAFIIALWALFALSMLAVSIDLYIGSQINLAGRLMSRLKAGAIAAAGVNRAIAELESNASEEYTTLNGSWSEGSKSFKDVKLGEGSFSLINRTPSGIKYGLIDEERKININKAPVEVLKNLFQTAGGVSTEEAEGIAACIKDWRDKDDAPEKSGAESFHYLTLSPPYECKNGDFEVLDELLLVNNITPQIFNKVKDMLTVYGDGAVNINTADLLVLESLGMSEGLAQKIVSFRKRTDSKEDENVFKDSANIAATLSKAEAVSAEDAGLLNHMVLAKLLTVRSDNFRGDSAGKIGRSANSFNISFVFDRGEKAIRYWRED